MRYLSVSLIILSLLSLRLSACTTVIAGKDASATGHVLIGRNEDDPDASVRHGFVEGRTREGTVPSEEGRAALSESESCGYYWIELLGPEGGLTAADSFLNENGVFIGSNNCALSNETSKSSLKDGGIEYNLRRLAAERAESAADAVSLILSLINKYGYAPSGRTYTVADKDEAWVIAAVRGKHYAARRVRDDEVAVIPNHYTIRKLEDGDIFSEDLISYAEDNGWYSGEAEFDFAESYQEAGSFRREYNTLRHNAALSFLSAEDNRSLPFSIKPDNKVTVALLKRILSSHIADSSDDPHSKEPRGICTATTAESDIFVFADSAEETVLYSSFGHPCTLPYIRMMPLSGNAFYDMEDPEYSREHHLEENPGANAYHDDIWHRMRSFQYIMEEQDRYTLEKWHITKALIENMNERGTASLSSIADILDRISLKTFAVNKAETSFGEDTRIEFYSDTAPDEDTIILYRPMMYKEESAMHPVSSSIREEGSGMYSAAFDSMELYFQTPYPGCYEYVLSGKDRDGCRRAGLAVIENPY